MKNVVYSILIFVVSLNCNSLQSDNSVKNLNENTIEMIKLIEWFDSIVPRYNKVNIIFEGDKIVKKFMISEVRFDSIKNVYVESFTSEYDKKIFSSEMDSMIFKIGWSRELVLQILDKLNKVNCVGINNIGEDNWLIRVDGS